jgi:hypothetical protein
MDDKNANSGQRLKNTTTPTSSGLVPADIAAEQRVL